MNHLLNLTNLKKEEFFKILERGRQHRADRMLAPDSLRGKNVALLFEKTSTRTRLSFSVAVTELGGNVVPLEAQMLQMGRGESIEDTTEVLARYVHAVMVRARSHRSLEIMASLDRLSVINGLTDKHHPCQALADYMTMEEFGKSVEQGTKLAFIGEPNNVFNSLSLGAIFARSEIRIASPEGFDIDSGIKALLRENNVSVELFRNPVDAVKDADVVYTDVWVSMGQEKEEELRKKLFAPYCVSEELLKHAAKDHLVLHCLPAHRGEEITAGVMDQYGPYIFQQAENRLHVQKAILEWVFGII